MAETEFIPKNKETGLDTGQLERVRHEQQEKIQEQRNEKRPETARESLKSLADTAAERAKSSENFERTKVKEKEPTRVERRRDGIVPKKEKAAKYRATMKQVQAELPLPSRIFSKVIHNKAVERASDAIGSTVARPNAILAGSFTAFVFTLVLFLVARWYGYPLSGTETIAAFAVGWMIGLLIDYLRLEFTGGKS